MQAKEYCSGQSIIRHTKTVAIFLAAFLSISHFSHAQKMDFNLNQEVSDKETTIGIDLQKLSSLSDPSSVLSTSANMPIEIDWDWKALLEEPNYFEEGISVVQIGIGLFSTVNVKDRAAEQDLIDVDFFIPSLHIMYERQVWKNVGAGISFGTQMWKVPILDYKYRYYTIGLRGAYHLNIIDKLDPYIALGTTFRRMVLANSNRNIAESKMTFHFVIGSRYYFTDKIGAHLEIGNDMTSWTKFGLSYYIY